MTTSRTRILKAAIIGLMCLASSLNADTITRQHDELGRIKFQSTSGGTMEVITFDKNTNLTSLSPTGSAPAPPAAPTVLVATNLQPNAATYSWTDNASNETGYLLERRIEPAGAWQTFSLAANTISYPDTALAPATLYRLRLTAQNASGSSTPIEITFTTPNGANLPANLSYPATGGSSTYELSAGISWSVSSAHSWLTAAIHASGPAFSLTITAPANPNNVIRTGTITVTSGTSPITITVTQAANTSSAANATLTSLTTTGGDVIPSFNEGIRHSFLNVPYSSQTIGITAVAAQPGATIRLNGTVVASAAASSHALGIGSNVFTLLVTSADESQTLAYSLTITRAPNAPGQLERSFLDGGKRVDVMALSDYGFFSDIKIQHDGKMVLVGNRTNLAETENQLALVRLNRDGTFDTSFGSGGKVIANYPSGVTYARKLALQSDGKILVGANGVFPGQSTWSGFAVIRFNTNGTLDPTYGSGGVGSVVMSTSFATDFADIAFLTDGTIILAGTVRRNSSGHSDYGLAKLTMGGLLDTSFGSGGKVTGSFGGIWDKGHALIVQPDDKLVIVGEGMYKVAAARYHPGGSLDSTFGTGGKVAIEIANSTHEYATAAAIQPDGKLLLVGPAAINDTWGDSALVRLNSNGSLDSTFGTQGIVTSPTKFWYVNQNMLIQPDGKILVSGSWRGDNAYNDFGLVRFTSSGLLDTSFSGEPGTSLTGSGAVRTDFGGGDDTAHAIAQYPDGQIIAVGNARWTKNHFAIASYFGQSDSAQPILSPPQISSITSDSAVVQFSINPNGSATTASIDYGTDAAYASTTSLSLSPNNGTSPQSFTLNLTDLVANQLYYWRLRASNAAGTSTSPDDLTYRFFSTLPAPPPAPPTVLAATNLQPNAATYTWTDNANNETSYLLERRIEPAGGWQSFSVAANATTYDDTSLIPATLYRVRLRAHNPSGSSSFIETTFTTKEETSLPPAISMPFGGATHSFALDSGATWSVTSSDITWLSATIEHNEAAYSLVISAAANPNNNVRSGRITVLGNSITTIDITQAATPSANADLVSLSLSAGSLSPVFSTATMSYTASVSYNTSALFVTPLVAQANAVVAVNGSVVVSGNSSPSIPLSVGLTTITTTVTAQNGSTTKSYTIDVTRRASALPGDVDLGFNPNAGGGVHCTATQLDGKILVGGSFTTMGGVTHNRIARLNPDGNIDPSFNPDANNEVMGIAIQADGKIIVVGSFTTMGGASQARIARLLPDGTLDTSFNPTLNWRVACLAIQRDGNILIGGDFTTINGTTRNHMARLTANGTLDANYDPNVNGDLFSMALQADGKVIVGGWFTTVGGVARKGMARVNNDGSLDASFAFDVTGDIYSLAVQADGKLIIGGNFRPIGGLMDNYCVRTTSDGALDTGFNPGVDSDVYSIGLQADGRIVIGGYFYTVGATARRGIARLNANGTLDTTFNPASNGSADSVAIQPDGTILCAGQFTAVGGVPRNRIARLENNAAIESLQAPNPSRIEWLRGGAAPEVMHVSFDLSTNGGLSYSPLGDGTRISGGWELTGLLLQSEGQLLARARTFGGITGGSSNPVQTVSAYVIQYPEIVVWDNSTTPATELLDEQGVIQLGGVAVGTSTTRTFSIHNTGSAPLTGVAVTVDGQAASDVIITQPTVTSLASAGTSTFSVQLTPTALGPTTATLHIVSNDSDENTFDIQLSYSGLLGQEIVTLTQSNNPPYPISGTINADGYSASLKTLDLTVNLAPSHAPKAGLILTLVRNTSARPITGTYENLPQGALVNVPFEDRNYPFVINYFGGNGNDIELRWAVTKLFAWGANNSGQLGDGTTTTRTTPVEVDTASITPPAHWIKISSGANHSLALAADGRIFTWGYNGSGSLGDGTTTSSNSLVPVNQTGALSGKHIVAISAGQDHSLALASDGKVFAWGQGLSGRLGDGFLVNRSLPVAVDTTGVLNGKTVTAIAASNNHSLVLTSEGKMYAWGLGSDGRLGNGLATTSAIPVAVDSSTALSGKSVVGIATGAAHNLAITSDGRLVTWGLNSTGQLGDGTTMTRSTPVGVAEYGSAEVDMAGGSNFSLLVKPNDGVVFAWGANNSGQIGDGTSITRLTTHSGPMLNLAQYNHRVSAGASHAYSLAFDASQNKDGRVWAWGSNSSGQLGSEGVTVALEPVYLQHNSLLANRPIMALAKGSAALHSLAIVGDVSPTIADWRQNYFGTSANSGNGADLNDYDKDGIANLVEYATAMNPLEKDLVPMGAKKVEDAIEFTYTKNKAATDLTYSVEWSDTLGNDWTPAGVSSPVILSDSGTTQQVKVNVPAGNGVMRRFVRLKVTRN